MIYLEKVVLPDSDEEYEIGAKRILENGGSLGYYDNAYPCGLFTGKHLRQIDFDKVTIIYGGNGSGKSTLLNIIASKLNLKRTAPFNIGEMFPLFVKATKYKMAEDEESRTMRIPNGSSIITSDDIFDYMLAVRSNNEEVEQNIVQGREDYTALKYGERIKFKSIENYDEFRLQVLARQKSLSRRMFLRKLAGTEVKLNSNGETAIDYYNNKLTNDTLFCLDEPENSLSPKMQLKLRELIEKKSRYCGCQFIIATHSPFILSIEGAKIYNLDNIPVSIDKWWELENTKIYFDFFNKHKKYFGDRKD